MVGITAGQDTHVWVRKQRGPPENYQTNIMYMIEIKKTGLTNGEVRHYILITEEDYKISQNAHC